MDLTTALPLPTDAVIARYADDFREVVRYDPAAKAYSVTYDWLENGQPQTFAATPITVADLASVPRIEVLVAKRVREVREFRAARS